MAVAGINNVSVLESSYFGDNYSPVTRRWANQEKPITRTSFIRKLWRDLEDGSKVRDTQRKQTSALVNGNIRSHCSCSSADADSEDMSINTSEAENECPLNQNQMGILNEQQSPAIGSADKERVRQVFREWGSKNNSGRILNVSQRNNCSQVRLICDNESNRVRTVRQWLESNNIEEQDGLGVDHTRVGELRSIRFRYGKHALLDLLKRFGMERENEMQSLMESRPVSTFAHRKRIQVLLKGRFLWNQRFVEDEKSSSTAASELGLLRQSQTVSDLRKGFLTKVNNHEHAHDVLPSDNSSDNDTKYQENQQLEDIVNEYDTSSVNNMTYQEHHLPDGITNQPTEPSKLPDGIVNENKYEVPSTPPLPPPTVVFENRDRDHGLVESNHDAHQIEPSQQSLELRSQYESDADELEVDQTFDHLSSSEIESGILSWQEELVEPENSLTITESTQSLNANSIENQDDWMYQETVHEEWYDDHPVVTTDALSWPEETVEAENSLTVTESIQSLNANSIQNQDDWMYQETVHEEWYDNHPVVTTDAFYSPDDDNENNTRLELQRLVSRRRVSNLLQSDFRGRLEHMIQSYLARQDQASELDEGEYEHENDEYVHVFTSQQSIGEYEHENDEAGQSTNPADSWQQHPGTELEIINGLRMDMVMLQERMNSMQSTLEACMKMQLELQRSVQQEVSSALNRSSNSGEGSLQSCFLCCDSGSGLSPDRGGHVYVCAPCAEKINWSKLKESVRHP